MDKIWLQHYPKGVPSEIDAEAFSSIPAMLDDAVSRHGDAAAFLSFGKPLSFARLDALALRLARYLQQDLGLKPGQRVALMIPNLLQYPVALYGVLRAGLVVVNVNPLYTAPELEHQLADCGAETIIVCSSFTGELKTALPHTPVKTVIVTGIGDLLPWPMRPIVNAVAGKRRPATPIPGQVPLLRALAAKGPAFQPPTIRPPDLAFLQYTGGTTGVSKGAMLTHRNVVSNVLQTLTLGEGGSTRLLGPGDVGITPLPLYHIFALNMIFGFFLRGGTNLLIPDPRDLKAFIKTIAKTRFRLIMGINTLFNALLNHPDFDKIDVSQLKFTLAGGAATQAAVAERWFERTGCVIYEGYGLTEASPVISYNPPAATPAFNGTVGFPIPSQEVAVLNEAGQPVPLGEPGELSARGPNIMAGYWNRADETAKVLSPDGWLRTGDIARIEPDGRIRIVDREKDMILVSGFNVYPNEVEAVLVEHPGVLEAAVIGVPDPNTGEAVKAFVVRRDPALTAEDLIAFSRKSLTGYKRPHLIEFRDSLPKTPVGKLLRRALRDEPGSKV